MNYIDITSPDINNGLGCRVTLWISGCPFHCKGCHNPESWNPNYGKKYTINEVLPQIKKQLSKEYIAGLTLCGGEPLCGKTYDDLEQILNLVRYLKNEFPDKNIWIYSGATYEELIYSHKNLSSLYKDILNYCDVLVDGQYMEELRDIRLPFRGSKNQRIIDLNKTRKSNKITKLVIE